MTRILRDLGLLLLLAGVGLALWLLVPLLSATNARQAGAPRPVVSEMLSDSAARPRPVPGFVAARNEVALGFLTLGRVTGRSVDLGDRVKGGEVLARLDPEDLDGQVRAAEAALAAAQAQFDTATITAERTRQLAARNVATTAQLEQVESALAAAAAGLDQAQSQLVRARDQQGFAELTAPFDGVITGVWAEAGEVVTAGAPVVTLSGDDLHEAVIDLTESEVQGMVPGTPWQVWQEAEPERRFDAPVDRIAPMADQMTRTRRVHLTLPPEAPFRLGALVRAARGTGDDGAALTLPASAVLQDGNPQEGGGTPVAGPAQVWVVIRAADDAGHGTVTRRDVQIMPRADGRVTVSGLPAGTEVVTRGIHSLTEGQAVAESTTP